MQNKKLCLLVVDGHHRTKLPIAEVEGKFISAFVRATKPAVACCAPGCCS